MSARSNASGKRPIISNDDDNNALPPQPGDPLKPKHDSPFRPGVQDRTLRHMDGAFQTMSDNFQAIEQYVAHLEELLLCHYSPESIQYHVGRMKVRDGTAGSQSIRGRQRTNLASLKHGVAVDGDPESLFISENDVSSRKRMPSAEFGSLPKKARTDRLTSSGAPLDLGESLLNRRSRLNSSSSETVSSKTVRKPSGTTQHTATTQRATSAQNVVVPQKTALKPALEAVSLQTAPVRQSAKAHHTTTTRQMTPNQMAQRQDVEIATMMQGYAKNMAKDKSLRHPSYPSCIPNKRVTSNFQPAKKPVSSETAPESAQLAADDSPRPPAPRFGAASRLEPLAPRSGANHSVSSTPSTAAGAHSVPQPRFAADARPGPCVPASSANLEPLAGRRDAAVRPDSCGPRPTADIRSDTPAYRPTPPRPGINPLTGRRFSHHIIAPRSGARQLPPSRSRTPMSSSSLSNPGSSSSAQAQRSPAAMRPPAVVHRLPARPRQSNHQNRPPRF